MDYKKLANQLEQFKNDINNIDLKLKIVKQLDGIWEKNHINNKEIVKLEIILSEIDENHFLIDRLLVNIHLNNNQKIDYYLKKFLDTYADISSENNYELIRNFISYIELLPDNYCDKIIDDLIDIISKKARKSEYSSFLKGLKHYYQNNFEEAIDFFIKTTFIDKSFWLAYFFNAYIYYELKNYNTAINYFKKLLESSEKIEEEHLFDIYFTLSYCYSCSKDLENEHKYLKKCLKFNPKFEYANNNLGYCLYRLKNYDEAIKYLDLSIKYENDGLTPFWNKVRVYKKTCEFDKAINILECLKSKAKSHKTINKEIESILKLKSKQNICKVEEITEQDITLGEIEIEVGIEPIKEKKKGHGIQLETEKILEDLLEQRIIKGKKVFSRNLKVYNGEYYGRQYPTIIGRMDILTQDMEDNSLIIVELKRGKSDDEVVGQISRYLSWTEENLAKKGQDVKGIICIKEASEKLKYAVKSNPNIELYEYEFDFVKII